MTHFTVGAPAPSVGGVQRAVEAAVASQPQGALEVSEQRSSPGHRGEGWSMMVSLPRKPLTIPSAVYAGVAEAMEELGLRT